MDQAQDSPGPTSQPYHQKSPSRSTLSPELLNPPATTTDSAWILDGLDLYDGNVLLGGDGFMDTGNISTGPSEGESLGPLVADVWDTSSSSSAKGNGWLCPLHIAAQKGHDRIVRALLEQKVDCNERDSDRLTPLMYAAIGGYEEVARSLLSHGASVGDVDSQGRSALHLSVLHRHEALLNVLLNGCAGDQSLIDGYENCGRTPLHTAIETGFEAGVHVLLGFGANPHYKARKP